MTLRNRYNNQQNQDNFVFQHIRQLGEVQYQGRTLRMGSAHPTTK